ncbi:hypothetical protein SAMN06272735_5212 [Streptomyces sp. TLI_55]|uniref:hypothetical protein n=1 Tax=Streptomyces sp. TLI_55 TaxID=1938861 RepID=UPI000BCFE350|nr:hypothetical protein [Streptomyces sp. TLI_55]SNX63404.1 hypothetical protein SAMN06272735_5212 [Streptomyces sp. TLI_55]
MKARGAGPALRVAVFGLTVTLVGYALLVAWLAGNAYVNDRAVDHYREHTGLSLGQVLEDASASEDVHVSWTDAAGHEHIQIFPPPADGHPYRKYGAFPVGYDPTETNPSGHYYDYRESGPRPLDENGLVGSAVIAALFVVALCAAWARRGLTFRRAARRPGRPMTADARIGTRAQPFRWQVVRTPWLVLDDRHWQRVMWHPALAEHWDGTSVTVHGNRTALVVLPDGTRLVPVGRLRHRAPTRLTFTHVRTASTHAWWWQAWPAAAYGAVFGFAAGFWLGDGTLLAVVGHTLAWATLSTAVWALWAPEL